MTRLAGARARRAHRPHVDELIRAARADDRARFDRLFDLWFDAVFAAASRRSGAPPAPGSAEEVTADVLRRVLREKLPTAP